MTKLELKKVFLLSAFESLEFNANFSFAYIISPLTRCNRRLNVGKKGKGS